MWRGRCPALTVLHSSAIRTIDLHYSAGHSSLEGACSIKRSLLILIDTIETINNLTGATRVFHRLSQLMPYPTVPVNGVVM